MADSNAAMLRASGVVTINGTVTSNSSAVFSGDTIHTADNSSVVITSSGSMVAVPSASSIVYRGKAVELGSGAVEVTTSNGFIAKADKFTVTPASSGSVKYQVTRQDRNVIVTAKQGSVVVSDGSNRKLLPEGSTTESLESGGVYPASASKFYCCILPGIAGLAGGAVSTLIVARKSISNSRP
jgi:ferric-dicitrate binding protein FerR (iron transport regulator)